MSTTTANRRTPSTEKSPSVMQVFGIARALLDVAGLPWPANRAEASDLLVRIRENRDEIAPSVDLPF